MRARLSQALARRLWPRGPWHAKQLAAAVGASPDTLLRLYHGQQDAIALLLHELARVFASAGDNGFLAEVFGPAVAPLPANPAALLREALRQIDAQSRPT